MKKGSAPPPLLPPPLPLSHMPPAASAARGHPTVLAVPATLTPANRRAASRGRAASLAAGIPLFAYRQGRRPIGARRGGWQQGTLRAQVDEAYWGTLWPIGDASRLSGGRAWPWTVPPRPDGGATIRFSLGGLCSPRLITTERAETEELRCLCFPWQNVFLRFLPRVIPRSSGRAQSRLSN